MNAFKGATNPQTARSWPVVDNFLPDFCLPSSQGHPTCTADYRHRRSLILVFVGERGAGSAEALVSNLAARYGEVERHDAEVLAVVPGSGGEAARFKDRLGLPFPVLADENGEIHRAYGAVSPDERSTAGAVYVAGKFGKVYLSSRASDGPPLPGPNDILGTLHFIEAQCPECGRDDFSI